MVSLQKKTYKVVEFSHPSVAGTTSITYNITHNLGSDFLQPILFREQTNNWSELGTIDRDTNSGNIYNYFWDSDKTGNTGSFRLFRLGATTNVRGIIKTLD